MAAYSKVPIQPIKELEQPFLLRFLGFTLTEISDGPFLSAVLASLEALLKKNKQQERSIIRSPVPEGVAFHLASLAFDHFLSDLGCARTAEHDKTYDLPYILEELIDAWCCNGLNTFCFSDRLSKMTGEFLADYDMAKTDERVLLIHNRGIDLLYTVTPACRRDAFYPSIRHAYALEVADRLLHDRIVSAHIAWQLVTLAPQVAEDEYGRPQRKPFVSRVKWPAFVKPLILARDRGKCAHCKTDIAMELLSQVHIDHIFPLQIGGCNDVVNLQLLCQNCNLKKSAHDWEVHTSVPRYHRRFLRTTLVERRNKLRTIFE